MNRLAFLAAVALLLLAAFAAFAPATLLDARLQSATEGRLRLADASGTVWMGRGLLTDELRTWFVPVGFGVDPRSIMRGETRMTLRAPAGGDLPRGDIEWRDATLTFDGVAFALPAAVLNGAVAPADTLALGGYVALDARHVTWNGQGGEGAATAQWSGARIASNGGTLALGTVTLNLAPRGGQLVGRIGNQGGDVRVDGDLAWGVDGIAANVTLTPLPSTPPAVARVLAALGTPDAVGAVRVQWRAGQR